MDKHKKNGLHKRQNQSNVKANQRKLHQKETVCDESAEKKKRGQADKEREQKLKQQRKQEQQQADWIDCMQNNVTDFMC